MRPKSVVVAAAALGDYTAFCRGALAQPVALLVRDGSDGELAVFVERQLIASHALRGGMRPVDGRGQRDGAARSRRGLPRRRGAGRPAGRGVAERQRRRHRRGHARPLRARERAPRRAAELLRRRASRRCCPRSGAALGAVREGVVDINLLPAEHRPGLQEGLFVPLLLVVAAVILALVYGGSIIVRDEMTRRALAREAEELEPQVAAIKKQEADVRKFQTQITTLTENQDRRTVHFLKELTDKIPTDAYLTTLRYRNNRVEMDGFATKSSELIQILEKLADASRTPSSRRRSRKGRAGRSGSPSSRRSRDELARAVGAVQRARAPSDRRGRRRARALPRAPVGDLALPLVPPGPAGRDRRRTARGSRTARPTWRAPPTSPGSASSSRSSTSRCTRSWCPGDTPTLAAANLQNTLHSLAGEKGVEIQSTQVMRDDAVGDFRRIAVRITVTGDLKQVADFLAGVEHGPTRVLIPFLEISRRGAALRGKSGAGVVGDHRGDGVPAGRGADRPRAAAPAKAGAGRAPAGARSPAGGPSRGAAEVRRARRGRRRRPAPVARVAPAPAAPARPAGAAPSPPAGGTA